MSREADLSRRDFIRVTSVSAGSLLVAIPLVAEHRAGAVGEGLRAAALNAYVRIDSDGTVTVLSPKIEMGQGTHTSLPMIVAEELDADWSAVRVDAAPLDQSVYGWQGAGGSTSVWQSWDTLRRAGAAVREMLVEAAAQRWGVVPGECRTAKGRVHHDATGRSLGYGALAAEAARRTPPAQPRLKDPAAFTIVGQATRQVGLEEIGSGQTRFASDTRVANLRRVVVERGPFGCRPLAVDDTATRRVPGVRDVVALEADAHAQIGAHGVAVVADSTWAALQGRRALDVRWSESDEPSSEALRDRLLEAVRRPGTVVREDGDVDRALGRAARTVQAEYELPFLAHATMEPGSCFVDVRPDRVVVRAPLQDPEQGARIAAALTGLPRDAVTVEPARLGGGFGRRLTADLVAEAVVLARKIGAPLQLVWTREDDMRFDRYRPAGCHGLRAGLDATGRVTGWRHRIATTSIAAYMDPAMPVHETECYADDLPAGVLPDYRVEYAPVPSAVPRGYWRSVAHPGNAFAVESFIDELAHAAGRDPVTVRLELLGGERRLPYRQHGGPVLETARLRRVIEMAAERAGWGRQPWGMGRGIAARFTFGSYAAQVADVSVERGRVRVHRVVAAIDCGVPVNPAGIRAQVEGGVVFGLTAALHGSITVRDGRVEQGNFHDYPLLRMSEMPEVDVLIVPSDAAPRGTGETSVPPIAPAVANAVFAATGVRVRRLPIALGGLEA